MCRRPNLPYHTAKSTRCASIYKGMTIIRCYMGHFPTRLYCEVAPILRYHFRTLYFHISHVHMWTIQALFEWKYVFKCMACKWNHFAFQLVISNGSSNLQIIELLNHSFAVQFWFDLNSWGLYTQFSTF